MSAGVQCRAETRSTRLEEGQQQWTDTAEGMELGRGRMGGWGGGSANASLSHEYVDCFNFLGRAMGLAKRRVRVVDVMVLFIAAGRGCL